jgi:protein TonB
LVIDGEPEFYESTAIAVRQWEYKPYLENGQPVEVYTDIEVNYTLR